MRKEIYCDKCNSSLETQKSCEICGMILREFPISEIGTKIFNLKGNSIELRIEGTDYDFCSMQCLLRFVLDEIKKELKNEK